MIATAAGQPSPPEAEQSKTPPRPPAFVWDRPFPLSDRITPGTLCVAHVLLYFDDDTSEQTKRPAVLHMWSKLQSALHVTTKNGEYVCRVTGVCDDYFHVYCPGDLLALRIYWGDLRRVCEVVPFPLPQLCEMGGAS